MQDKDWKDNKLTDDIMSQLVQGTKVMFRWHGNSQDTYTGRIEIDKYGNLYFVNEHCYENDILVMEGMRYYNRLDSFLFFTFFQIISNESHG